MGNIVRQWALRVNMLVTEVIAFKAKVSYHSVEMKLLLCRHW